MSNPTDKLYPVIATEIEFYLPGAAHKFSPVQVLDIIKEECSRAGIRLESAEQERGIDQYEVALLPHADAGWIAGETEYLKQLMADAFFPHGIKADFSAKPFADQPGSGLHVHIHLEDENGRNVFYREDETFSRHLLHAIGGLLALMNPSMLIFAPNEESYLRFNAQSNTPTTVSWGTNNRTTAIRLPNKPMDNKHIEHRVAGSDADVAKVIEAILIGVEYGITHQCDPGEPVYGDASLPQYKLPLLARSLSEARQYMTECKYLSNRVRDEAI